MRIACFWVPFAVLLLMSYCNVICKCMIAKAFGYSDLQPYLSKKAPALLDLRKHSGHGQSFILEQHYNCEQRRRLSQHTGTNLH